MKRSLAVLPLLLSIAALISVPASANAADAALLDNDSTAHIVGDSVLVNESPNKVKAVNLKSGRTAVFATPNASVSPAGGVMAHGFFAAIGLTVDGSNSYEELFVSGPNGAKTLASWPVSFALESYKCRSYRSPLAVDSHGRVTAHIVTLVPTSKSGPCAVKRSATSLTRFDPDGSKRTLYLPDKYKRWSSPYLRGDRLAIFRAKPRSRVAVLNIRTRTATEFSPGSKITGLEFANANTLLVTRQTGLRTVAKRFSTNGRPGRTIYSGSSAIVTSCGEYTAIGTPNWISIRDRRGKQVYRRAPAAAYEGAPAVKCSGGFLYFHYSDMGCSTCGPTPEESKLIELGKL